MTTTILDRFLDPITEFLPSETARRLVELRLDPVLQVAIDNLAMKANQGTLTESERAEYQEYVEGLDLIAILKAKARLILNKQAS